MRDLIKDTPLIDRERYRERKRREKKAQHPAGFEPTTSLSQAVGSTAVLQPLPKKFTWLSCKLKSKNATKWEEQLSPQEATFLFKFWQNSLGIQFALFFQLGGRWNWELKYETQQNFPFWNNWDENGSAMSVQISMVGVGIRSGLTLPIYTNGWDLMDTFN